MAGSNDWLGGYTLEELLGAPPVSKTKKQLKGDKKQAKRDAGKRGIVSATVGAPFRLLGTIAKLPLAIAKLPLTIASKIGGGVIGAVTEVVKLPARVVGAIFSPWRKR